MRGTFLSFIISFVHLHPVMYTFPIGIARFNWSCNTSRYTVDPDCVRSLFLQEKRFGMKGGPCRVEFKSVQFISFQPSRNPIGELFFCKIK